MKRALLRNFSICTQNLLHSSPPNFKPILNNPSLVQLADLTRSRLRFYSSESDSSIETKLTQTQNLNDSVHVDDVSNEEFKRQIEKYFEEGDENAIPSIFEAILKRKLAGKHEESDDELMEEFRQKSVKDEEFDSDFDEFSETDNDEIDDLSDEKRRKDE